MIPIPSLSMDGGEGYSVSAQGVGGKVPLVVVDVGWYSKSAKCSAHLEVVAKPCDVKQSLIKKYL